MIGEYSTFFLKLGRLEAIVNFYASTKMIGLIMDNIRFRTEDRNEKAFAREVRSRVHAYFRDNKIGHRHANLNMYIKTMVMLSLYLLPFIVLLALPLPGWVALALVVIMGIGAAGIGMSVMHDGAHGSYSSKKWVNEMIASTMYLLGGNTLNWKIQHNIQHHTYTNVFEHDGDIDSKSILRFSDHAPLQQYHRYQYLYALPLYSLMTVLRLFSEIPILIKFNRQGLTQQQHAHPQWELGKLILIKVVYLTLILGLPLALTDFAFWQILIGFLVMHMVAGIIMSTVFQLAHAVECTSQPLPDPKGVIHRDWLVHELETTANFGRKNSLLSWYIGGLDFQIEHHLFPKMCHVYYASIAPIVEKTAKEYGIAYHSSPSFRDALGSHIRKLKALGVPA